MAGRAGLESPAHKTERTTQWREEQWAGLMRQSTAINSAADHQCGSTAATGTAP